MATGKEYVERRYERLRPREMRAILAAASVAWVPIGTLEWHGEHLPFGVDAYEAHGIALRAADKAGGVVLPATYIASGCLDLDYTLTFDLDLVRASVGATVDELARLGFRTIVVLIGHGPLDLNHGLKQTCADIAARHPGVVVYPLVWYELNAARLDAPEYGEPMVVSHAAFVETSYMMALEPSLVALERLPEDAEEESLGVYGQNPRYTASAQWGEESIEAAADLLAERVVALARGERFDFYEDIGRFVDYCWPETLVIEGRSGRQDEAALLLTNPGEYSRFLTFLEASVDGEPIPSHEIELVNPHVGEGQTLQAASLDPTRGFYIRRHQTAVATLGKAIDEGDHLVALRLGMGGVRVTELAATVSFRPGPTESD